MGGRESGAGGAGGGRIGGLREAEGRDQGDYQAQSAAKSPTELAFLSLSVWCRIKFSLDRADEDMAAGIPNVRLLWRLAQWLQQPTCPPWP